MREVTQDQTICVCSEVVVLVQAEQQFLTLLHCAVLRCVVLSRIGRTGRAGRKGTAITFLAGHDSEVRGCLPQAEAEAADHQHHCPELAGG